MRSKFLLKFHFFNFVHKNMNFYKYPQSAYETFANVILPFDTISCRRWKKPRQKRISEDAPDEQIGMMDWIAWRFERQQLSLTFVK